VLFQHGALFSAFNVFDNIAFPLRELKRYDEDAIHDLVMLKLSMVELLPRHGRLMPSELSGGMVKRVALARALALEPELLLLDEPTAGLDPDRSDSFVRLIRMLSEELGLTVMLVTHDLDTLAALSTRVAVLAEQRILAYGTTDESCRSTIRSSAISSFPSAVSVPCSIPDTLTRLLDRKHASWKTEHMHWPPGIFTILLGIAAAIAIWWLGQSDDATTSYLLETRRNVTGLNVQAQVRYRGIRAGKVESIEPDPKDPRVMLVTINIDSRFKLTRAARPTLGYQGVTGLAYVLIEDDGSSAEPLLAGRRRAGATGDEADLARHAGREGGRHRRPDQRGVDPARSAARRQEM
jgi:energy-coupling factor transporter ATP-binding protein EcfA2